MAYFEGNLAEFNRYIGPQARNVIQLLTKRHKRGRTCESCGQAIELQAAHVHGEERIQIIERLLNEFYKIEEGHYRVNLEEFFERFKAFHLPIENHFKFLCEPCHKRYDREE